MSGRREIVIDRRDRGDTDREIEVVRRGDRERDRDERRDNRDERPRPDRSGDDKELFETSKDVKIQASFESMGLKPELLKGIYQYGKSL
jgi:hypothetical protein